MAKSGFVPAWLNIPNSDKTNRQRHHSSDTIDHSAIRHYSKEQSENCVSFHSQRSYNRENFRKINENGRDLSMNNTEKLQTNKRTLRLLSVPETSEEKEFLIQMGWNDNMNYEITDKDKEEYEKRIKLLPKTDNRSAALISALNRRTLPYINIRDVLQLEMINSPSDDDSSDE